MCDHRHELSSVFVTHTSWGAICENQYTSFDGLDSLIEETSPRYFNHWTNIPVINNPI